MKVAVVTGGGRGLGRAFALALARDHAVAVVARSQSELDETVALVQRADGRAQAFVADVADAEAVDRAFGAIERDLGPIDLLVNNAGVVSPLGPFSDSSVGDWWRTMAVNVLGPATCAHRVLSGMRARRSGRIINVASGGGAIMRPYFSAYITSKTALIRFSECLAAEVASDGVAVFAMGPGTVRTAMSEYSLNSPEGKKWLPWFKDIFDQGRDLPAERPAELVRALASGRFDALSGRFVQPSDDLDRMLASADKISAASLYTLQVPKL
jgi:NAD(P)-dependent dehydrogenase (short-subunit alcohol dehydrogenase family)